MRKLKEALMWLGSMLVVIGALAVTVIFYFIPKRDAEQRAKARRAAQDKAVAMKAQVAASKAQREARVEQKLAEVKKEEQAKLSQDTVDLANDIIEDKS